MSDRPSAETRPDHQNWIILHIVWIVLLVVFVGPVVLVGGYALHQLTKHKSSLKLIIIGLAVLSAVWCGIKTPFIIFHPSLFHPSEKLLNILVDTWLLSTPVIPLGAVSIEPVRRLRLFLKPKSLSEQVEEQRQQLAERDRLASEQAQNQENNQTPPRVKGNLQLGGFIRGDHFPPELGLIKSGRRLSLEENLLDQHLFILGATGAGKSETIKRLVEEIAYNTDRDIFLVDGKGDHNLPQTVRAICYDTGRGDSPIFRLGTSTPGQSYNGFRGTAEAIQNRLLAMVGVDEAEGNAQFFADINRLLLQLVCKAPSGPPKDFDDLLNRLDIDWLKGAWEGVASQIKQIERIERSEKGRDFIGGLAVRIYPLINDFSHLVNPLGFAFEDVRSAVFSLRTQSVGDTAKRFLQFFIEDLKDFTGNRQHRPGVLIIDEFGTFGNKNIIALLQLARSAQMGVILATQDIATLGDENTTRTILANTRTKILMASDYPEEIAKMAGTIYQVENSIQYDEGEATGMGSARIQHAFKIDMNEAGKLQAGEAFIIRQRYAAKFRVDRVLKIPDAPPEVIPERRVKPIEKPPIEPPPMIEL